MSLADLLWRRSTSTLLPLSNTDQIQVLGIALTDTFGTLEFLKAFKKRGPSLLGGNHLVKDNNTTTGNQKTYAQLFTGIRQDSGDPDNFIKIMREFYDQEGIKDKKSVVFSDSLNVDLCHQYKEDAEASGFQPSFGIGTYFTSPSPSPSVLGIETNILQMTSNTHQMAPNPRLSTLSSSYPLLLEDQQSKLVTILGRILETTKQLKESNGS
jgi:nicotinic acid phosphoribosyltransferase